MRKLIAALISILVPTLAFANGYESYPSPLAWSPDSTLLASVEAEAWPYNDALVQGSLRLYHFDGTPLHELLAGLSIGSPVFSRDGGSLICIYDGKVGVCTAPFEGSNFSFINGPGPALDCTFEPSAAGGVDALLVTFGERFYGCDIWRVSQDGGKLEQLTRVGSGASALAPLSIGYGSFLYHLQDSGSQWAYERLWHMHSGVKETETIQFTAPQDSAQWPDDYHESNPQLLPRDGDQFDALFQRGGWGDWRLYTQASDGAEELALPDAQQPSLSADGRWLAFTRRPAYAKAQVEYMWDVIPQVWLADRECQQMWRVETSIAGAEFPALSPDGTKLAWVEFNGGRVQTVVREVAEITAAQATETY